MDITPYYIDARNAITQPDKMVFLSQYFRRHWMPALGPLGTAIVIYLRGACYHNRKSGETRDTVQIAQREIAAGCGCSVPTIKRELERNAALGRFVQVSPEWERDGTSGRVRQLENHYKVAMDDPLTEADEARLRQMVEDRITKERQEQEPLDGPRRKAIRTKAAKTDGSTAISTAVFDSVKDASTDEGSNAVNTASSKNTAHIHQKQQRNCERAPGDQIELLRPGDQIESTPIQIELLSEESLLKTTQKQTFNVRGPVNSVDSENQIGDQQQTRRQENVFEEARTADAAAIAEELQDWGSERRHRQLLSVCERHGLLHLPSEALQATRERLTRESRRGVVERPGAYYQGVLLKLLEGHQVFVPKADEEDVQEVRRLIREDWARDKPAD